MYLKGWLTIIMIRPFWLIYNVRREPDGVDIFSFKHLCTLTAFECEERNKCMCVREKCMLVPPALSWGPIRWTRLACCLRPRRGHSGLRRRLAALLSPLTRHPPAFYGGFWGGKHWIKVDARHTGVFPWYSVPLSRFASDLVRNDGAWYTSRWKWCVSTWRGAMQSQAKRPLLGGECLITH